MTNTVLYVYDGNVVIQERDAADLPEVTYTRGLDLSASFQGAGGIGGLLARSQSSAPTAQDAFYFCDGNGNVTAMVNTNQLVVAKYSYDPFGNVQVSSGPLAEANLYRFSSKEEHLGSGLLYHGYRYYAPGLQRWVNRDPLGERGGGNLCTFVANNPSCQVDYLGLLTQCECDNLRKQILRKAYDLADDLVRYGPVKDGKPSAYMKVSGSDALWHGFGIGAAVVGTAAATIATAGSAAPYVAGAGAGLQFAIP